MDTHFLQEPEEAIGVFNITSMIVMENIITVDLP